jgi:hypothetical protein
MNQRSRNQRIDVRLLSSLAMLAIVGLLAAGCNSGVGPNGTSLSCSESVAVYCAAPGGCLMSWADVEAPSAPGFACRTSAACEGFNWAIEGGTDTHTTYFYDATSGNLVAVIQSGERPIGSPYACTAGPTTFKLPSCSEPSGGFFTCTPDGGTD